MVRLLAALGVVIQPATACWGGDVTFERCCDRKKGPQGDQSCWDEIWTFTKCCGEPEEFLESASQPEISDGAECWGGDVTFDLCCDLTKGPQGNEECWDDAFTFVRCCGSLAEQPQSGQASRDLSSMTVKEDRRLLQIGQASPGVLSSLKVDPRTVQALHLHGGGRMPMSGMGLCCRPSAQGDAVRQGVLDYLLLGGRHLDDAARYNNHGDVGVGLRQALALGVPRDEIFFVTKIWPTDYGFEKAIAWVDRILMELGLSYVDLVLLHKPSIRDDLACRSPRSCRQETWLALQRAQAQGRIRHLGVSNFGPRQMSELLAMGGAPIAVNQLEYHPWVPQVHRDTVDWCHQQGIAVTAYGSMGSAGLADQMISQEALQQMGKGHGKTAAQVMLRWAIQHNVSVIPGTSNPNHQKENLEIFDFALSAEEMAMLDNVPEDQRMLHFEHTPDASP